MKRIEASEFEARCLEFLDEVAESRAPVVITRNDRPIATLAPFVQDEPQWRGSWKNRIKITGDIMSPIDVVWEADS